MSPVYWHPIIYMIVMRLLYGRNFEERYRAIAEMVAEGSSLFEVCAGDCWLYSNYLKKKNISYEAGDSNDRFIEHAQKKGVPVRKLDLSRDSVPRADYIIIQASLYQFIPKQKDVLDKLLASANRGVIISEPVINLSSSPNPLIRYLAKRSANPGDGNKVYRFDEQSLDDFIYSHYGERVEKALLTAGGREKVFFLKK